MWVLVKVGQDLWVMGKLGGYKVGDGGALASVSVLVGVITGVVSFLGVWMV